MITFAATLKAQMQAQGINQTQLAAAIGLSKSAVSQLVNGVTNPSKPTLEQLAAALGCTVGELTGEETPCEALDLERDLPVPVAARMLGRGEEYVRKTLRQHPGLIGWMVEGTGRGSPYISPNKVRQIVGDDVFNKVLAEHTGKEVLV